MSTPGIDLSESRGNVVLGTIISFTIWAIAMVALRFYVRMYVVGGVRPEDWLLLVALLAAIGEGVAICTQVHYGLGRHIETIQLPELIQNLKGVFISIITYQISIAFTKISLLLGYIHIFPHPRIKLASKISIGLVFLYSIYGLLFMTLTCKPTSFFWDPKIPEGFCISNFGFLISHSVINMVTDIIVIVIPMPVLSSLNLARKAKLWLILVFGLGLFVIGVAVIRIPGVLEIRASSDPSWDTVTAACCTQVETCVAIICATLPPLRALVKLYFPSLIASEIDPRVEGLPSESTMLSERSLKELPDNYIEMNNPELGRSMVPTPTSGGRALVEGQTVR